MIEILLMGLLLLTPQFQEWGAGFGNKGTLVCNYTEVGLTAAEEHVTCSATATAVYNCSNGPQTASANVDAKDNARVSGGQAVGQMSINPPGGQCSTLGTVTYTNVILQGSGGDEATFMTVSPTDLTIIPSTFGPFP
jgi:hypothetical protein